jgi:hypothetical protein
MRQISAVVVCACMGNVFKSQMKRVNGGIGDMVCFYQLFRQGRLHGTSLAYGYFAAVYICIAAVFRKQVTKLLIVSSDADKKPAGFLNTVGSDGFEYLPLDSAFNGRLEIVGNIAAAGVEEPMVAS